MMHNNLFLNRLLIKTDEGLIAFDETFHKGVNIIRGHNSSGKSTITHFIFYALGGDFVDFVPEAIRCSSVYAEVEMNNVVFTITRSLEKDEDGRVKKQAPMFFYWGEMDESLNPPSDKQWQKFNYGVRGSNRTFSSVLFDNLDIPAVKGDNNITFHQILRLLYIDQESPTSSLFYYEHFDSQLTRETVSDLLLGVYNEELYENKRRLISAKKELDGVRSEIKATKKFFSDPLTLNPNHIKSQIENRRFEINTLEEEIISIRNKSLEPVYDKKTKLQFEKLNLDVIRQRNIVNQIQSDLDLLRNEIADSNFFIETLNNKIEALRNSIKTRDFLGGLPLEYCPECLTRIKPKGDSGHCKLCKESIDDSFGVRQARRMELEINIQITESKKILEINNKKKVELQAQYKSEKVVLEQLQKQVNSALNDVRSVSQETLDGLIQDKGFLEGEILQFETLLENAEMYSALLDQENELRKETDYLENFIRITEGDQQKLKQKINYVLKKEGTHLLNKDLERQDEFKNADEFYIDFSNNIAFLSNKYSKYSASSNFYLKVSARFALFLASLSIDKMRYPRFVFADNMEDKGIEEKRAQNLQKILIDRLSQYSSDSYQMIYTTSYITDELNQSSMVVGDFYTKENPSLKNIRS